MNTDNKLPIILGVTGHRNIKEKDYDNLKLSVIRKSLILQKKNIVQHLYLLTPLADGADRLVAKVALDQRYLNRIKIVIPLPFLVKIYIKILFWKRNFLNQIMMSLLKNQYKNMKI